MKTRLLLISAAAVLAPLPVLAQSFPWQATLRFAAVKIADGTATLSDGASSISFSGGGSLEAGISYEFSPGWAAELAWQRSGLDASASAATMPEFDAGNVDLSLVSLTAVHRFFVLGRVRPYLGVGVHLATFSGFDPTETLETANVANISIDRTASVTAQAGLDFDITERISVSLDVKFNDIGTEATLFLRNGNPWQTVQVDFDPWVIGVGAGYRF